MINREFRLLLTQACNYECSFCHKEGLKEDAPSTLYAKDYRFLFTVGRDFFDMDSITLSGGEPLLRLDIGEIINELHEENAKISVITNGSLLSKKIDVFKNVDRLVLSMHALSKSKYDELSKKNDFENVIKTVRDFRKQYENKKICLNTVLVKNINDSYDDMSAMIAFAKSIDASIKYIELFPPSADGFVSIDVVEKYLLNNGFCKSFDKKKIIFSDKLTKISFIQCFCAGASKRSDPSQYCREFSDLFISPDGKIKLCMYDTGDIDISEQVLRKDIDSTIGSINVSIDTAEKYCIHKR